MPNDEFKQDLLDAMIEIGEKRSKGFTSKLSSKSVISRVNRTIPTQSPELDRVLAKDTMGRYGMPVGRVIGIQGKEASGKTTMLIMLMAMAQKLGGVVRLYETEMAFDPDYAAECGVDNDEVLLSQPDFLEQGLDSIKDDINIFKKARAEYEEEHGEPWDTFMLIGFDSIAGAPPEAEYKLGSFQDDQARALHARILSKFFRWTTKRLAMENICLVMTNQTKVDTNVRWGSKDTAIGGKALRFHASIILEMKKVGFIGTSKTKEGESDDPGDATGIKSEVKTTKNKVLPPFKKVIVPIIFGKGIDYNISLFNLLKKDKVIKKSGSWYKLNVGRVRIKEQGEKKFIDELAEYTTKSRMRKLLEGLVD